MAQTIRSWRSSRSGIMTCRPSCQIFRLSSRAEWRLIELSPEKKKKTWFYSNVMRLFRFRFCQIQEAYRSTIRHSASKMTIHGIYKLPRTLLQKQNWTTTNSQILETWSKQQKKDSSGKKPQINQKCQPRKRWRM